MENILNYLPYIISGLLAAGLLSFEVLMPGFGVAGISGGILFLLDIILLLKNYGATAALGGTLVIFALTAIFSFILLKTGLKRKFSSLVLSDSSTKEEGYRVSDDLGSLEGKSGTALTTLRPSGIAVIAEQRYTVQTTGEYISEQTPIIVTKVEGGKIFVTKERKD
jgi:membrane-bound serine protease (ClpP class)